MPGESYHARMGYGSGRGLSKHKKVRGGSGSLGNVTLVSSTNKLPFMILPPPGANCRKTGFSVGKSIFLQKKIHVRSEKCTFLQKNA